MQGPGLGKEVWGPQACQEARGVLLEMGREGTWLWGKDGGQLIKGTGKTEKSWAEWPGEEGS